MQTPEITPRYPGACQPRSRLLGPAPSRASAGQTTSRATRVIICSAVGDWLVAYASLWPVIPHRSYRLRPRSSLSSTRGEAYPIFGALTFVSVLSGARASICRRPSSPVKNSSPASAGAASPGPSSLSVSSASSPAVSSATLDVRLYDHRHTRASVSSAWRLLFHRIISDESIASPSPPAHPAHWLDSGGRPSLRSRYGSIRHASPARSSATSSIPATPASATAPANIPFLGDWIHLPPGPRGQ